MARILLICGIILLSGCGSTEEFDCVTDIECETLYGVEM